MDEDPFLIVLERVRAGDEDAVTRLMERYGPQIRRIARIRLQNSQLQRVVESADICQSVMVNFYRRAMAGQFDLETPQQLMSLLATMTCNTVRKKADYHYALRRDMRRNIDDAGDLPSATGEQDTPSVLVARDELVGRVRELLSDEERHVLDLRAEGRSWVGIARELGVPTDRVRKRATRAAERVAKHLHLSPPATDV